MSIDSINRASSGSLGAPSTEATRSDLGPDAFMRLLITQIRNQDPLEPMDTRDMMAQLTQLTSVEQLVAIDGRLASLQVANAGMANAQASELVGRIVEADTSQVTVQDVGSAEGAFELDSPATTVQVTIRNDQGQVVRTLELGSMPAGMRHFDWDGNNDQGQRVGSGRYRIEVAAADGEGNPITARTRVRGQVDRIGYEGGYPSLSIGDVEVMMGDVQSVEAAPASLSPESSTR